MLRGTVTKVKNAFLEKENHIQQTWNLVIYKYKNFKFLFCEYGDY